MTQEPYNYKNLIESFVKNEITIQNFINTYLEKFLNEKGNLNEELFERLDWLFAEVNGYTDDIELLSDQPEFHFTETELRKSAQDVLKDIEKI